MDFSLMKMKCVLKQYNRNKNSVESIASAFIRGVSLGTLVPQEMMRTDYSATLNKKGGALSGNLNFLILARRS
jgi:hypothetical protein